VQGGQRRGLGARASPRARNCPAARAYAARVRTFAICAAKNSRKRSAAAGPASTISCGSATVDPPAIAKLDGESQIPRQRRQEPGERRQFRRTKVRTELNEDRTKRRPKLARAVGEQCDEIFAGAQSLLVIRALRLLRVFRVLKLAHFLDQANVLTIALRVSRPKILVFLGTIMIVTLIMGSAMYVIEGAASGFTNIPRGVYWAIVTLTTVGYGDLYPQTDLGRLLASVVMVMGYAIIAVPTGIVTAELGAAMRKPISTQACPTCAAQGHDTDARHCKYCGSKL
jgi:voltage-gated potassium channel